MTGIEFAARAGMVSTIYSKVVKSGGNWVDLAPPRWYSSGSPGTNFALLRGAPRVAHFLMLEADGNYPLQLSFDPSVSAPKRIVVPDTDEARQFADLPIHLCYSRPVLTLDVRHIAEAIVGVAGAPATAADGVSTLGLYQTPIYFQRPPASALPATVVVWGYAKGFWLPLQTVVVPVTGSIVQQDLTDIERIFVQGTVIPDSVTVSYKFSAPDADEVLMNVIVQAWFLANA